MNAPVAISRRSRLATYAGLYAAMWRNSVVRELSFKANFLMWLVVEALWFALQLTFVSVIYLHTESIGDWTKWQVVLLVGTSQFVQQVFTALFLTNCVNLSELVRTGRMDFMLLLPVNTRFLVSLRAVDLGAFVSAASGLCVVAYAAWKLGLRPGALQIAGYFALCAAGLLIHYALMFLMATICFWTVRAQNVVWGYYNLFNVARQPDSAFRGAFRRVFTFVIPMLLVSNVPAKVLIGRLSAPLEWLLLLGMTAACYAVSELAWRISVRHYASASS
jgi:ABC-2 type transport system permease protein